MTHDDVTSDVKEITSKDILLEKLFKNFDIAKSKLVLCKRKVLVGDAYFA